MMDLLYCIKTRRSCSECGGTMNNLSQNNFSNKNLNLGEGLSDQPPQQEVKPLSKVTLAVSEIFTTTRFETADQKAIDEERIIRLRRQVDEQKTSLTRLCEENRDLTFDDLLKIARGISHIQFDESYFSTEHKAELEKTVAQNKVEVCVTNDETKFIKLARDKCDKNMSLNQLWKEGCVSSFEELEKVASYASILEIEDADFDTEQCNRLVQAASISARIVNITNKQISEIPTLPNCTWFECRDCENLRSVGALPKCTQLECYDCHHLKNVGPYPNVDVTSYNNLSLKNCPRIETSWLSDRRIIEIAQGVNRWHDSLSHEFMNDHCLSFGDLRRVAEHLTYLRIDNSDFDEEQCNQLINVAAPQLKELNISYNTKVTKLPDLLNCEKLNCKGCPNLTDLGNFSPQCMPDCRGCIKLNKSVMDDLRVTQLARMVDEKKMSLNELWRCNFLPSFDDLLKIAARVGYLKLEGSDFNEEQCNQLINATSLHLIRLEIFNNDVITRIPNREFCHIRCDNCKKLSIIEQPLEFFPQCRNCPCLKGPLLNSSQILNFACKLNQEHMSLNTLWGLNLIPTFEDVLQIASQAKYIKIGDRSIYDVPLFTQEQCDALINAVAQHVIEFHLIDNTTVTTLPDFPECTTLVCQDCSNLNSLGKYPKCKTVGIVRCPHLDEVGLFAKMVDERKISLHKLQNFFLYSLRRIENLVKIAARVSYLKIEKADFFNPVLEQLIRAAAPNVRELDVSDNDEITGLSDLPNCEVIRCQNCRHLKTVGTYPKCKIPDFSGCTSLVTRHAIDEERAKEIAQEVDKRGLSLNELWQRNFLTFEDLVKVASHVSNVTLKKTDFTKEQCNQLIQAVASKVKRLDISGNGKISELPDLLNCISLNCSKCFSLVHIGKTPQCIPYTFGTTSIIPLRVIEESYMADLVKLIDKNHMPLNLLYERGVVSFDSLVQIAAQVTYLDIRGASFTKMQCDLLLKAAAHSGKTKTIKLSHNDVLEELPDFVNCTELDCSHCKHLRSLGKLPHCIMVDVRGCPSLDIIKRDIDKDQAIELAKMVDKRKMSLSELWEMNFLSFDALQQVASFVSYLKIENAKDPITGLTADQCYKLLEAAGPHVKTVDVSGNKQIRRLPDLLNCESLNCKDCDHLGPFGKLPKCKIPDFSGCTIIQNSRIDETRARELASMIDEGLTSLQDIWDKNILLSFEDLIKIAGYVTIDLVIGDSFTEERRKRLEAVSKKQKA